MEEQRHVVGPAREARAGAPRWRSWGRWCPRCGRPRTTNRPARAVCGAVARLVLRELASAWGRGWQPGDVLHLARRGLTAAHVELLRAAIGVELAGYPPSTMHPRWHAQLEEFDIRVAPAPTDGGGCIVVRAAAGLGRSRWAPRSTPPPSWPACSASSASTPLPGRAGGSGVARAAEVDPKVLARVKALLAKAESTHLRGGGRDVHRGGPGSDGPAQHRRSAAGRRHRGPQGPTGLRVWIDAPYESAKVSLLSARRPGQSLPQRSGTSTSACARCSVSRPTSRPSTRCSPHCWCRPRTP